jgi:hypothetical protein
MVGNGARAAERSVRTAGAARVTNVHLLLLGYFRYRGRRCAQDVALALGLSGEFVAALLGDLEAADMITAAPGR